MEVAAEVAQLDQVGQLAGPRGLELARAPRAAPAG